MNSDHDEDIYDRCSDCGTEFAVRRSRSFSVGSELVLCFECAVRRGGKYDEQHDHWDVAPDSSDLPRELE